MAVQREWAVGRNTVHFEEPDLLIARMGGPTGLEDAKVLTEIYREVGIRQPFFAIIDVTNSPADAAARRYFTREIQLKWFRGVVYVGAGVLEKAIAKAMAAAFFFTRSARIEFLFADTVEEARVLVDEMRARLSST